MKKKIIRVTTVAGSLKGLLNGQLKHMTQYYDVIGVASSASKTLYKVGKAENIKVIPVEMTRKITPLSDLYALFQLYKIFNREKPDIVHTHTPKAGTLGMLAAFLAGVPLRLHTIAGMPLMEATGLKRSILNLVEKFTYKCATMIYPNSFGLKDFILESAFTSPEKLMVIGKGSSNGINTNHFDYKLYQNDEITKLKEELGIKPDDYVFIYVGRFVKDKGINELAQAFSKVYDQFPQAKLLLVGFYEDHLDPLDQITMDLIDNHQGIICAGWQEDVRPYFAISDVLAFPSYREGFPNVVMQAGAMGIPVIGTDINGSNEIIIDGENGVIIPVKHSDSLANAMLKFVQKQKPTDEERVKYRNFIISRYEQEYIWSELKKEYDRLLN